MTLFIRLIPMLLAIVFLGACTSFYNPFAHGPNLVGTWKNKHGSLWTLRPDGTFEISHGGHLSVTGTYWMGTGRDKNKITLNYTGGAIPWDGHEPGTYRIKLNKRGARFVILHDICALRIAELSTKWKRQQL